MYDIDLIPPEYHKKRLYSGWLKIAGLSLLILSAASIASFFWLRLESAELQQKIEQLQSEKTISNATRQQIEQLNQQKKDLSQQLKLLAGLRSGAPAEQMFVTIDAALPAKNVWVTGWKFRRAGTPVENVNKTVSTGYFLVIPQGTNGSPVGQQETWKIETQMTLQGQSMDHAALSEFVLNLTRQPEIEQVRIVNTRLTELNKIKLVNFSLEIVVSSYQRNS